MMIPDKNHLAVMRDDHDWLLELGRQTGDSRIITSRHPNAQALIKQFRPPISDGLTLPWAQADEYVRFMPRKVTVWSGPTFSGKTAFLRQLMLHAINNRHRVLFVSLEEEPDDVWREFICMASLTRSPTPNQREWCLDLWEESLFVFDSTEMIDPTLLMGIIRFAAERHKLTHIVIDSLMRLNLRTDDYEGQREMGNMLGRLARLTGCHIHLVAHPRKTANSRQPMDLYDIRGAQDIVAQADLVVSLERKHDEEFDSMLTIWKQRGDVNWIGSMKLYYDKASRQLKYTRFDSPIRFLHAEAYEA
jgi:KaiC/GvpD/RAD55 family RecA-like ATPase